jgi:serine phosphatase RsbU (regulator of sigma subunit)
MVRTRWWQKWQKAVSASGYLPAVIALWVIWLTILGFVETSQLNDSVQTYISRPVQFQLREKLHQTPDISKKLKIFALDDQTVGYLQGDELDLETFTVMLENIARKQPQAIILDRLFAKSPEHPQIDQLLRRLRALEVPVYSGAYLNPRPVQYLRELHLSPQQYKPTAYGLAADDALLPEYIQPRPGYLYGHAPAYDGSFHGVGHIGLTNDGSIFPFLRTQNDYLIPHLALYSAESLTIDHKTIYANRHPVPVTEEGLVYVNHRPLMHYYKQAKSLRSVIVRARQGIPEKYVAPDDVVLVLFNFYTGSTDFFSGGPFGEIPGGLIVATLIDSVIQGKWLTPIGYELALILAFGGLGLLCGTLAGAVGFWLVVFAIGCSYFGFATFMFSYQAAVFPWVLPLVSFLGSGLLFYAHKRVGSELTRIQIEKDYYSEKSLRLEEENHKIKLEERLNLGRAVQEILLPQKFDFEIDGCQVGMRYSPAQEMSGDWLYIWHVSPTEKRIMIGDVVGKGPSAAIPVAVIVGILGECETRHMTAEQTLKRLNERLVELFQQQITTTCTMIIFKGDQSLTLLNAGSPGWFTMDQDSVQYIPLRSSPLGIAADIEIAVHEFSGGDQFALLTFTDGYLEGSRGFRRLQQALKQYQDVPESWTVERFHEILDTVGEQFRLEDDRSMLAISRGQTSQARLTG